MPALRPFRAIIITTLLMSVVPAWNDVASGHPIEGPSVDSSSPNILLIVSDDQSWSTFNRSLMPNVFSDLVDQGALFNRAYVNSSVCCPSRSQIMTGLYEHHTGVDSNDATLIHPTIIAGLHEAGYRTALEGKYLNSWPCTPRAEFDRWVCMGNGLSDYSMKDPRLNIDGAWVQRTGYSTDILADDLLAFVNNTPADQPFFAMYSPTTPHLPADDDRCFDLPVSPWRPPSYGADPAAGNLPGYMRRPPLGPTEVAGFDTTFAKMTRAVSCLDGSVGHILDNLGPRANNTLVFYISDNGFEFGEHRRLYKWVPYEESVRVPLIVRYPTWLSPSAPVTSDALVSNVDIAPTIAEAVGLSWTADGISLGSLIRGQVSSLRSGVLIEGCQGVSKPCDVVPLDLGGAQPSSYSGVVTENNKYVEYATGERELYDLVADPNEMTNHAGEPAYSAIQQSLASQLATLQGAGSPDTTIVSGPSGTIHTRVGQFTFYSQARTSTYTCRLDKNGSPGTATPCNLGKQVVGPLGAGQYTFLVAGKDQTADSTPATRSFTITDTGPPVTIDSAPPVQGKGGTLSFSFSSPTSGVTYKCQLSPFGVPGTWSPCTSPVTYSSLQDATWLFQVRATAGTSTTDPPAQWLGSVDNIGPQIYFLQSVPAPQTRRSDVHFVFVPSEPTKSLTCRFDSAAPQKCTRTYNKTGLAEGLHRVVFKAKDLLGNVKSTVVSWIIDRTPPVLTVTLPPQYTNSDSASITWSANEPPVNTASEFAGRACSLDGVPLFGDLCGTPVTFTGLADGLHTYVLQVTDNAHNVTPVHDYVWTVDTVDPVTSILSGPADPTTDTSATFTFSASDATAVTFTCSLDGSTSEACASGQTYLDLAPGPHAFEVMATDAAGNVGPAATASWTITS